MTYWRYIAGDALLECAAWLRKHKALQAGGTAIIAVLLLMTAFGRGAVTFGAIAATIAVAYAVLCLGAYVFRLLAMPPEIYRRQIKVIRALERQLASPAPAPMIDQLQHIRQILQECPDIAEIWVSELLDRCRRSPNRPPRGLIEYPAAIRAAAEAGWLSVLEGRAREYTDYYGDWFGEDLRIRIDRSKIHEATSIPARDNVTSGLSVRTIPSQ
jgi:hypothetical protein